MSLHAMGDARPDREERDMTRFKTDLIPLRTFAAVALGAASLAWVAGARAADDTIFIPNVVELSGAGAVSGTNWRDGIILAVEEINAKGGILGKKLNVPHLDTQ